MNVVVNGLSRVTRLRDYRMSYTYYYRKYGFMVRSKAIPEELIRIANIRSMKKRFLSATPEAVFNQRSIEEEVESNPERKQLVTKEYDQVKRDRFTKAQQALLARCEKEVLKIVRELLPGVISFKTIESLLYSREHSEKRQKLHRDLRGLDDLAALALVCFEPKTRFIMCRGTHVESSVGEIGIDNIPAVYELDVGDILIFHPSLIHAGDRYEVSNLRLHYYAISTTEDFDVNITYPFDPVVKAKLKVLIKNTRLVENRLVGRQVGREWVETRTSKKRSALVIAREARAANRKAKKNDSSE